MSNRYLTAIKQLPLSIKLLIAMGVVGFSAGALVIASGARSIGAFVAIISFALLAAGVICGNIYAWNVYIKDKVRGRS